MTCPFCGKGKVNVYHKEGFIQAKTSRISAGGKQTFYKKPDEYHVQNDCPECGKSKKEIERAFETGITRKKSHQEKLNRLKEAGLPTRIEGQTISLKAAYIFYFNCLYTPGLTSVKSPYFAIA